jgi:hypothetical protein
LTGAGSGFVPDPALLDAINQGPPGEIPAVVVMHDIKAAYRYEESPGAEVQPGDNVILRPGLLNPDFGLIRALKGLFNLNSLRAGLDLPFQFKSGKTLEFQFEIEVQPPGRVGIKGQDKPAEVETIIELLEVIRLVAEGGVAPQMNALGNGLI